MYIHDATEEAYKRGLEDGKSKWIPVTERLPKPGKRVTTYGIRGGVPFIYIDQLDYTGFWFFAEWNVTHWMPLPEAPAEEAE